MPVTKKGLLLPLRAGSGRIDRLNASKVNLALEKQPRGYGLAQMDDYLQLPRSAFHWNPPLQLSLRAYTSIAKPTGTLGFGFWNDPFSLSIGQAGTARRFPASPQALWFFYASPPNDIALAPPVPGFGWKASVLRAPSIPTLFLAPAALAAITAAQIPVLRRFVMTAAIRAVASEEALIHERLEIIHDYKLIWESDRAQFFVDGREVLKSSITPRAPLGFVIWIDNQYAIASPEGGFRFGVLPTQESQSLVISELQINGTPLSLDQDADA